MKRAWQGSRTRSQASTRAGFYATRSLEVGAYAGRSPFQLGKPISAIVGPYRIKSVQYRAIAVTSNKTVQEAVRAFGLDDWTVQVIVDYSRAYSKGFGDFVTDSLQSLTGHTPRDIGTFAREVMAPTANSMAPARRSA